METIYKTAWILIKDGKVLFLRSKSKDAFYCPGGKIDAGETDEESLIREIKEELDVEIIPSSIAYLHTISSEAHGKPLGTMLEMKCFKADHIGTLKPSAEIEEMRWMNRLEYGDQTLAGKMVLDWLKSEELID